VLVPVFHLRTKAEPFRLGLPRLTAVRLAPGNRNHRPLMAAKRRCHLPVGAIQLHCAAATGRQPATVRTPCERSKRARAELSWGPGEPSACHNCTDPRLATNRRLSGLQASAYPADPTPITSAGVPSGCQSRIPSPMEASLRPSGLHATTCAQDWPLRAVPGVPSPATGGSSRPETPKPAAARLRSRPPILDPRRAGSPERGPASRRTSTVASSRPLPRKPAAARQGSRTRIGRSLDVLP